MSLDKGSRRVTAFRDHLLDGETGEIERLVSSCNMADGTRYSSPLDADMFFLMRERNEGASDSEEAPLIAVLCIWHLGSTRDGRELDEVGAFTDPGHRRQGAFTELYAKAQAVLRPCVLFSIYKNPGALGALGSIGGELDHSEYLMRLSLSDHEAKADEAVSFMEEGEIVHAEASFGEANFRLDPGGSAYIFGVLVYESMRGKGYGRRLLDAVLGELSRRSAREAVLEVFSENAPAVGLYKSLGFSTAERIDYGFACGGKENMI